ncbi:Protein kinase, catalytic domain-containing protein [Cynara cardunculus var. scolymus]|uniref:RING-type E3 ubiquitin transferase n=1 Tax=Cynara cardunculus var. scolymus TaxID=59895 RepID=A0A118K498_CYNCS|nr:Protein kinase, catalytic domain-containing protein [Cynara cardunculus var. scolymus]
MGSEVEVIEDRVEEFNDVENTIFVAVGKNVKESKSLISCALQCFARMKICLLHIHQPGQLVTLLDDKFSASRVKDQVVKACRERDRQKMHKILNEYNLILDQAGVFFILLILKVKAGKVWIEAGKVETGIVQTIVQHGIRWLVMGAAAEKLYSKESSGGARLHTRSIKALPSSETALTLYHEADASMEVSSLQCLEKATSAKNGTSDSLLVLAIDADEEVNSARCLENSMVSTKNVYGTSTSTSLLINYARGNGSTLPASYESQDQLVQSCSAMFLEGPQGLSSSDLLDKLEYATTEAENSKQKAFEESIRRWKAEEDAKEAIHKAEASEKLCMEEITQIKEMEATLVKQNRELETMKNQQDEFKKELQMVRDQKPGLVDRISKARDAEKELEEKIIQAVNLLITFKERRDNLQDELDNARRQINGLANYDETTNVSQIQFYKPSFLEIMEATQDLNQSLKIGEGRCGSVYKGILRHVRVAIKMLPSLGSQGEAEFEREAEVLSRMRHPNLVMLIGVCTETRSLIYEYLENGSLEDRIASRSTTPPLPWQTRIRISSEICSALIFLHGSKPHILHGNLMLTNVLLDSNYVSKLSDLGINRLIFCKDQTSSTSFYHNVEPEVSAYMDPELLKSGKLAASSDIYSFGVVLLRILTGRPASSVVNDTRCALENGNFGTILDSSAGNWPIEDATQLAYLGLRCCENDPMNRPDLVNDIWTEVMEDPYIAADGFTYEADAIKGWLNSGHKTSPMTNLKLDHCDLLPNHALSYAIQEWQQQHS